MTRPVVVDVTRLIEEATLVATETAARAPRHLQWIVFSKAFDVVATSWYGTSNSESNSGAKKRKLPLSIKARDKSASASDPNPQLFQLDSNQYPEISHTKSALDNSLHLLRIAKNDFETDGLQGSTIAQILTEHFRCRFSRQAIGIALNKDRQYVYRQKIGRNVFFRIMAKGEDYLQESAKERGDSRTQRARKKSRSKLKVANESRKKARTRSASPNLSPATAMSKLYKEGYFSEKERTISDIANELKDRFGIKTKPNELSPLVLAWTRSGKLLRRKNAKRKYAYKKP